MQAKTIHFSRAHRLNASKNRRYKVDEGLQCWYQFDEASPLRTSLFGPISDCSILLLTIPLRGPTATTLVVPRSLIRARVTYGLQTALSGLSWPTAIRPLDPLALAACYTSLAKVRTQQIPILTHMLNYSQEHRKYRAAHGQLNREASRRGNFHKEHLQFRNLTMCPLISFAMQISTYSLRSSLDEWFDGYASYARALKRWG